MKESEIIKRYESLWSVRKTVEQVWDLIERYVVPGRGRFFREQQSEHSINWRHREIYDSTAVQACQTLAASIQGSLTSPSTMWFSLRFRSDFLNEDADAMAWLEACADTSYRALQESNFNIESSEAYIDLTSFGTAVITEEEVNPNEWEGLDFSAIPIRQVYFEEDHRGQVKRLYRRIEWTATQILDKFGKDGVPEMIKQKAEAAADADGKIDVIFCVYERENKKKVNTGKMLAPKNRPYGFKYILKEGATLLGEEGGYYEMPAFVVRWLKTSGSAWGHSPAIICLSDILTLQRMVELMLKAAEKAIDPPALVEERSIMGDLDLKASGYTVVRHIDGIKPYESGARFDVSELSKTSLQKSIRQAFLVDQLELKESPAMTATEVQVRYELMQRLLGPTMGRLQNDYLNPLIVRTFFILYRAGRLPEAPDIVKENASELDIEYIGPMARAQKQADVMGMERWIGSLAQLAEVKPEILDLADFDAWGRELAKSYGVPAKAMNSNEDIEEIRTQRAQQQAMAQEAAMMQEAGAGMKAVGEGAQAMEGGGGQG